MNKLWATADGGLGFIHFFWGPEPPQWNEHHQLYASTPNCYHLGSIPAGWPGLELEPRECREVEKIVLKYESCS